MRWVLRDHRGAHLDSGRVPGDEDARSVLDRMLTGGVPTRVPIVPERDYSLQVGDLQASFAGDELEATARAAGMTAEDELEATVQNGGYLRPSATGVGWVPPTDIFDFEEDPAYLLHRDPGDVPTLGGHPVPPPTDTLHLRTLRELSLTPENVEVAKQLWEDSEGSRPARILGISEVERRGYLGTYMRVTIGTGDSRVFFMPGFPKIVLEDD